MAGNHEVVEIGNTPCNESASPSSSSVYHSTRIEGLLQSKSDYETALDFEIAASKDHWSEFQQPLSVVEDSSGGEKGKAPLLQSQTNYETALDFEIAASKEHGSELQQHSSVLEDSSGREKGKAPLTNSEIVMSLRGQFPQTGNFFRYDPDGLVFGEKIAEGAQAEIFEIEDTNDSKSSYVLKVFKEGSSVLDLQKQWPLGMLNRCADRYYPSWVCSAVLRGTVVKNGRFAFMMSRCAGDLRKLIDKRMERNSNNNQSCAPFSGEELAWNMFNIANGMKALHQDDIVHRDLKASNVLIQTHIEHQFKDLVSLPHGGYDCLVADYECSVGVVGTAFWRAPEILQGVKARNVTLDLFTKEADVYSFAMTCYEMITGRIPFEGVKKNNYDVVLRGDRPTLPEETKPWIKTLLNRCWHSNPKERPSFQEIRKCIQNSTNYDQSPFFRSFIWLSFE